MKICPFTFTRVIRKWCYKLILIIKNFYHPLDLTCIFFLKYKHLANRVFDSMANSGPKKPLGMFFSFNCYPIELNADNIFDLY